MKKYYAKPDQLYLNTFKTEQPPIDEFKKNRKFKEMVDTGETPKPNSFPLPDNVEDAFGMRAKSQPKNGEPTTKYRPSELFRYQDQKETSRVAFEEHVM